MKEILSVEMDRVQFALVSKFGVLSRLGLVITYRRVGSPKATSIILPYAIYPICDVKTVIDFLEIHGCVSVFEI